MFDKKLLESAEFYERRYRNFATLIIIPIFLLFVFLVVFSIFGKRELTVKSAGQIVPRKVLSVVQSTSSNPIELNKLVEGRHVKQGDVLLTYKVLMSRLWTGFFGTERCRTPKIFQNPDFSLKRRDFWVFL